MALEIELKYFEKIKNDLIANAHEGKYALIKGEVLAGTFERPEDAYNEGVKQFGQEPFLVKQILKDDRPQKIPVISLGILNARL